MFVRSGLDHDNALKELGINCSDQSGRSGNDKDFRCAIPIRHRNYLNGISSPWKIGDNYLDWYGAEPGQSNLSGSRHELAQGSPLDWTTNHWPNEWGPTVSIDKNGMGETSLNRWGQHNWILDVDMDCSRTIKGWFELKSYISNGPGCEGNLNQSNTAYQPPFHSRNHVARCGYLNVFKRYDSHPITIEPIPGDAER